MADQHTGILDLPYQASAEVLKKRFVVLTGDQTVAKASVLGEKVLGVAMVDIKNNTGVPNTNGRNEITDGKGTAVHVQGVAFVYSGAAVARNVDVTTDATGRAVAAVAGNRVAGVALKGAATAGELIPVLLAGGTGRIA